MFLFLIKVECSCFRVALFFLSKNNNSSFEILFPNVVSFLQLAFFSLFSLVSIFRVRGLLQISKNPLLPVEWGGGCQKASWKLRIFEQDSSAMNASIRWSDLAFVLENLWCQLFSSFLLERLYSVEKIYLISCLRLKIWLSACDLTVKWGKRSGIFTYSLNAPSFQYWTLPFK